jgi:hypothetical protein
MAKNVDIKNMWNFTSTLSYLLKCDILALNKFTINFSILIYDKLNINGIIFCSLVSRL